MVKEKKRYLVVEVNEKKGGKRSEKEIVGYIRNAVINFMGVLGYAKSNLKFVRLYEKKEKLKKKFEEMGKRRIVVLSANPKFVDEIRTSIMLINIKNIYFETIGVSGTLKKAMRFIEKNEGS